MTDRVYKEDGVRACGYTFGKYKYVMGVKGVWHKIVVIDGEEYPMCLRHKKLRFLIVRRVTREPNSMTKKNACKRCMPGPNFNRKTKAP